MSNPRRYVKWWDLSDPSSPTDQERERCGGSGIVEGNATDTAYRCPGCPDCDQERERLREGERVEFGPMPGNRYEIATVLEDEPEPRVRIRYESDGKEVTVDRSVLRRPES